MDLHADSFRMIERLLQFGIRVSSDMYSTVANRVGRVGTEGGDTQGLDGRIPVSTGV